MPRQVWFPTDDRLQTFISSSPSSTAITINEQVQGELWYSANEFDDFKSMAQHLARAYVASQTYTFAANAANEESEIREMLESTTQQEEATSEAIRGLERMINILENKRDRILRRKECIRCVLMTQTRLGVMMGIDDESKCRVLARVSMQHSAWARQLALDQASMDEYVVVALQS